MLPGLNMRVIIIQIALGHWVWVIPTYLQHTDFGNGTMNVCVEREGVCGLRVTTEIDWRRIEAYNIRTMSSFSQPSF